MAVVAGGTRCNEVLTRVTVWTVRKKVAVVEREPLESFRSEFAANL